MRIDTILSRLKADRFENLQALASEAPSMTATRRKRC